MPQPDVHQGDEKTAVRQCNDARPGFPSGPPIGKVLTTATVNIRPTHHQEKKLITNKHQYTQIQTTSDVYSYSLWLPFVLRGANTYARPPHTTSVTRRSLPCGSAQPIGGVGYAGRSLGTMLPFRYAQTYALPQRQRPLSR